MRRAIALAFLLLAILAPGLTPRLAAAASSQLNGIGLVDYTHKPDFKVGDWVRYRMSGRSELGIVEDYTVTLLISGEMDFWGDPAFWIETWREEAGSPPEVLASLVSYDIFRDSVATQRLQIYTRAVVSTLNEEGVPRVEINKPAASILKARHNVMMPIKWTRDTLGVDTVVTAKGTFRGLKTLLREGTGSTQSVGDSTVYQEMREERTSYHAMEVPITHLGREEVMSMVIRKAWLIGRSGDAAPFATRDKGLGTARLLDFGHGGLEPRMTPPRYRMTIAAQRAAEAAAAKPRPSGARTAGRSGKP